MAGIAKPLVWLALASFVLAIAVSFTGPIMEIPAEAFSRACTNLALLSIAMMLAEKSGSGAGAGA